MSIYKASDIYGGWGFDKTDQPAHEAASGMGNVPDFRSIQFWIIIILTLVGVRIIQDYAQRA